jgi:hypothetical protein
MSPTTADGRPAPARSGTITRTVEVFADVTCPFTHVGLHRFVDRRRALGRDDVQLWVRAWPLELVNDSPLDPCAVAPKVAALRAQVAPDLFTGFDPAAFPATTIPALVLAGRAYQRDLATGEHVSLLLRDALFEHGRDVSDPLVLHDIARRAGVAPPDPSEHHGVLADWREGVDRHVVGSPHFFLGDDDWFCPTLRISRVDDQIRIERDVDAFERFMDACFGG